MGTQEPSWPPEPPGDRRRSLPDGPRLHLCQLRRGQTRGLALRLVETRARDRLPTEFFLDLRITCDVPDRMYSVEVKADLGRIVPYIADLTVLRNRHERTQPMALVERGVPVERKLSLEFDGSTERVVFWVRTAGAACVPERMAAMVEVREPAESVGDDDLDTMRLPTVRLAVKKEIVQALSGSCSPALSTLADLMESDDHGRKTYHLGQLAQGGSDVRFVEAAVRDLDLCEQMVEGFLPIDLSNLCLSDVVHAAITVFHPSSSPFLVYRCLVLAVVRQHDVLPPEQVRLWRQIIAAAVILLRRRAPGLLDEALEELGSEHGPNETKSLRETAERAVTRPTPVTSDPVHGIDQYLRAVRQGATPEAAESAAIRMLAQCGFIWISAELE